MTTFLLIARHVHATAACCDYLADRLAGSGGHTVQVLGLPTADSETEVRDAEDALNATRSRLTAVATVETETVDAAPVPTDAAAVADDRAAAADADEIVVAGGEADDPERAVFVEAVVGDSERPVVVVPA